MGDFKEPTALLKNSRGIFLVLVACHALITQIPADEEPLCGNAVMYAIVIMITITTTTIPWSQRFSFAAKRRDKREKEAARENLW